MTPRSRRLLKNLLPSACSLGSSQTAVHIAVTAILVSLALRRGRGDAAWGRSSCRASRKPISSCTSWRSRALRIEAMNRVTLQASLDLRALKDDRGEIIVRNFGSHIGRAEVADEVGRPKLHRTLDQHRPGPLDYPAAIKKHRGGGLRLPRFVPRRSHLPPRADQGSTDRVRVPPSSFASTAPTSERSEGEGQGNRKGDERPCEGTK